MHPVLNIPKWYSALIFASLLLVGSCGGGGSGDNTKTLVVDFSYPQRDIQLWKPVSMSILATGLEGNTPNCQLLTGRLPIGLTLQATGCAILGTPTEVTSVLSPTIRLTVPGFEGQADKQISILVFGPPTRYDLPPGTSSVTAGTPFSISPIETNLNVWTLAPGETVRYEVASGALPDGLRLTPLTGTIAGVITARNSQTFNYSIGVTTTSVLGTYSSTSLPQSIPVSEGLSVNYPGDCPCRVGFFWSMVPIHRYALEQSAGNYVFSNFRLAPTSGALPPGFSLDANTGVISGTPTASGVYQFVVLAEVATSGQIGTISGGLNQWGIQP